MINANPTSVINHKACGNCRTHSPEPAAAEPQDSFRAGSSAPEPVVCPRIFFGGPGATIEPWLRGEPTNDPAVSPQYADKAKAAFGDQAITSIQDDRVRGVGGYFLEGWESAPGGDDWLKGVTLGRLGDKWEMTGFGKFEIKSGDVRQSLSFDMGSGTSRLETSYDEHRFETSTFSEILTIDRDGEMRREHPPVGL
ncbi:MAG: hypothetical protein AB7S38_42715 [Vulcanimicrobiota bacterium]